MSIIPDYPPTDEGTELARIKESTHILKRKTDAITAADLHRPFMTEQVQAMHYDAHKLHGSAQALSPTHSLASTLETLRKIQESTDLFLLAQAQIRNAETTL